jgi:dTMP kinase
MPGLFIVFEGLKGAGRKTQIDLLEQTLRKNGLSVAKIAFPNFETEIARLTRREDYDPYTLALLYAADRSHYQQRIKALLEQNQVVICDRYCYSNFAFQAARGISLDWLQAIEENIIKPKLVVLLDLPVDVAITRIRQANIEEFTKREIIERMQREKEVLKSVRDIYLQLARTDTKSRWLIIDATQPVENIAKQIASEVLKELTL